ncbi:interleukin-21 receptor-like isoform X2 [Rhinoderma darwinii]|uniref:interleukin-21 receptor-like isoform X2 n=1 Tax=Rhinoderma darwinii TaxID=43563 RepID=UPI003F67ED02
MEHFSGSSTFQSLLFPTYIPVTHLLPAPLQNTVFCAHKRTFEESDDTCILVECEKKHEYICTIDMEDFNVADTCTVTITTNLNGRYYSNQICKTFMIGENFKPVPAFNLTVSLSENYNISWETFYDTHDVRSGELAYELSYKKDGETWLNQKIIQVLEDEKNVVLLRSTFQADEQYVARIRAQPKNTSIYRGHWSEWSTSVTWTTPTDDKKIKMQIGMISGIIAMLAFLGIVMTCFRYTPPMWKKVWVLVPNPESYFEKLYTGHQGDFKSWLGPHYNPFSILPYEGNSTYPEDPEIHSHSSGNNIEIKKPFLTKSCLTEKNQICILCVCMKENLTMRCCSQCFSSTTTEGSINGRDGGRDDGYPTLNLGSGNMLDHLLDRGSDPQSTIPLEFSLHEDFLRSNMNMLNLVSIPTAEWELQESPPQEDDENVFYNDDNYNSMSPDSRNSAIFGYPRTCLDMDTIDSGFVDSECGSPVDSDFGNSDNPTKLINPDPYNEEDEISERNYVQQWVPTAR